MAGEPLLDAATLARLERLQLRTSQRLAGRFSGEHRSRHQGTSLDFADYRQYHPGDDFRRIDYHLYARLDQLLLKIFEAEEDVTVRLLIDTSASMAAPAKFRLTKQVAAAIGFVSLVRRDAVTVATFPFGRLPPRFNGRAALGGLLRHLEELEPGGVTEFAGAVTDLLARRTTPGLTVVISDLLTEEWATAIRRLPARGDQAAVVHIVDPSDHAPEVGGDIDVVDRETGATVAVSASPADLRALQDRVAAWQDEVADRCRTTGVAYTRVTVGDDLERALFGSWRTAGLVS